MDYYLHDFRQDIVSKKRRNKEYWNNWDGWNILYKTLAYELSSSRDIESYGYVKMKVFEYFSDYEKYISGTTTLDIMNGWWFCFKTLFGLENRKSKKTTTYLKTLKEQIRDITRADDLIIFINREYKIEEEYIKSLLEFLDVAYTIGNITPVSSNRHADYFDSWEYKLFESDWVKYKKGLDYKNYFIFSNYSEKIKWWNKLKKCSDPKKVVLEYMNSRIYLIKERGEKIVNRK